MNEDLPRTRFQRLRQQAATVANAQAAASVLQEADSAVLAGDLTRAQYRRIRQSVADRTNRKRKGGES